MKGAFTAASHRPSKNAKITRMKKVSGWALTIFLSSALLLAGCKTSPPSATGPSASEQTHGTVKGVGFSPRSNSAADFTGFLLRAKEAGDIVMWAGDWNQLNESNGGPAVIAGLASQYGYTPVIKAQFFSQSTGEFLRPLDGNTKQLYKDGAAEFARKQKLKYLGLGIEVNILFEKSPADFEEFVMFFSEVYDAVKAVSPETKIFTVFQLERIKGLAGGLFGGTNDPANSNWGLLGKFPKADLFAFTSYPGLIFKDPDEIPEDYYFDIRQHTNKPVAFTEIGWHSEASPAGWESSEAEQAIFIERFFSITQKLNPELAIWSILYDQPTGEPFRSMGMLARDDIAKEAWEAWEEAGKN